MAEQIESHDLLTTLIEAINSNYTGKITITKQLSGPGIIILMKNGQIYKITGSEREGISALTELIKWKSGIVRFNNNVSDRVFEGLEPMNLGNLFQKLKEEHKKRLDPFVHVFFYTILQHLMNDGEEFSYEEGSWILDVLESVESPAVIHMKSRDMDTILILIDGDSSVQMTVKQILTFDEVLKFATIHKFSYSVYPLKDGRSKKLFAAIKSILGTDVFQDDVLMPPFKPQDVQNIINSHSIVIFYTYENGNLLTLPCVEGSCWKKDRRFKNFFKKEVLYVAW